MSDNDLFRNSIVDSGMIRAGDVIAHPHNPKFHPVEQRAAVKASFHEAGIVKRIIINQRNGYLVDGHERTWLALEYGEDTLLPVDYVDIADDVHERLLIYLDGTTGMARTDPDILQQLIDDQPEWEDKTLQALRDQIAENAGLSLNGDTPEEDPGAQVDRAAELNEKWQVKRGDLWQIGEHRLLCGDSTIAADVARLMGDEKAQGAFTSPPYAEQRKGQYDSIPADEYVMWWNGVQSTVRGVLADDGSFFVNIKPHCEDGERVLYVMDLVLAMCREWNWLFVDELYWQRQGYPGAYPNRFKNAIESIFHFSIEKEIVFHPDNVVKDYYGEFAHKKKKQSSSYSGFQGGNYKGDENGARPSNLIIANTGAVVEDTGASHPATFPVALPEFFLKAYSQEDDTWYDPFGGSGTTMVACEQLSRQCRMMEISPPYCAVVLQRLSDMGLEPKLISRASA